jgi:hypothetical protein
MLYIKYTTYTKVELLCQSYDNSTITINFKNRLFTFDITLPFGLRVSFHHDHSPLELRILSNLHVMN